MSISIDNPHTLILHDSLIRDARELERSEYLKKRATMLGITSDEYRKFIGKYPYFSLTFKTELRGIIVSVYSGNTVVKRIIKQK